MTTENAAAGAGAERECSVCGFAGAFEPGPGGRPGARCPSCSSLERNRLLWLFLASETDLLVRRRATRLLHLAPEAWLVRRIGREKHVGQLTADAEAGDAMLTLDGSLIPAATTSFEVAISGQLPERTADDRLLLRELYRVLAPGGWAVLSVAIGGGVTDEDPGLEDPGERARRFGRPEKVRRYGRDFLFRVAGAGFDVSIDPFARRLGNATVQRFGLSLTDEVIIARKPPGGVRGGAVRDIALELRDPTSRSMPTGRIDEITLDDVVVGWVWRPVEPRLRLAVRAILDGEDVGGDVADRERVTLARSGIGDGSYGFRIQLPAPPAGGRPRRLAIRTEAGTSVPPGGGFTTGRGSVDEPWYVVQI